MKIMTMNTHSLIETGFRQKREWFAQVILRERPEILALQEVNQTMAAPALDAGAVGGYRPCPKVEVPLKEDNYAAWLAGRLAGEGLAYTWTWLPMKVGYDRYDEGMALFSLLPVAEAESFRISQADDYSNWKTRKVLGIRTGEPQASWYYTVHMGWWDDGEEPFDRQWKILNEYLDEKKAGGARVWLMGDFNSPSQVRGQGYDRVTGDGWLDSYELAERKDSGVTVGHVIDGWRERPSGEEVQKGMRLDYLFTSKPVRVLSSRAVCNGDREPQVSDHYGVMIETV